jgi:hypothetical protein
MWILDAAFRRERYHIISIASENSGPAEAVLPAGKYGYTGD